MRVFLLKDSSDGSIEAELVLVDPYMADDVHKNSMEGGCILDRKDCSVNLFLSHPIDKTHEMFAFGRSSPLPTCYCP